ncbi:MAG: AAA family ATPase [Tunicatimonas sp.]
MLPSLSIRNYRNLKSLDIERLARVNLIAGKNNTGKTSLLEAVSLYAAGGSLQWIDELLKARGEFYSRHQSTLANNLKSYGALFYKNKPGFLDEERIVIGPSEDVQCGITNPKELECSLSIRFIKKEKKTLQLEDPVTKEVVVVENKWILVEDRSRLETENDLRVGLSTSYSRESSQHQMLDDLDRENNFGYIMSDWPFNLQFVRTLTSEPSVRNWDKIDATDDVRHVIEALQIIEPDTEKLAFVANSSNEKRSPEIKLSKSKQRVPLKSMGDGMNRILTIILALVNSKDGYLLIDEFENGLHHKVQQDLWKMIFQLATELNVQVFATTHSDDCVEAFENVLNDGNQNEGLFIRLEKQGEVIKSVLFDAKELQVATDHAIEIR